MEREEIFTKVVDILVRYKKSNLEKNQITETTTLLKDLDMNSARLVDMILDIEDAFHITIQDTESDSVNTVGDCINLVKRKLPNG